MTAAEGEGGRLVVVVDFDRQQDRAQRVLPAIRDLLQGSWFRVWVSRLRVLILGVGCIAQGEGFGVRGVG